MVMKGHSTLLRSPEPEPHHQIQFSVILRTSFFGVKSYPLDGDTVSIFWTPLRRHERIMEKYLFVSNFVIGSRLEKQLARQPFFFLTFWLQLKSDIRSFLSADEHTNITFIILHDLEQGFFMPLVTCYPCCCNETLVTGIPSCKTNSPITGKGETQMRQDQIYGWKYKNSLSF